MKLSTQIDIEQRLRKNEAIPPLFHMLSRRGQEQLYLQLCRSNVTHCHVVWCLANFLHEAVKFNIRVHITVNDSSELTQLHPEAPRTSVNCEKH